MCHWMEADTSMVLVVHHWMVDGLVVHHWVVSNLMVNYWMVASLMVASHCWMVINLMVQRRAVDTQSVKRGWLCRCLGCSYCRRVGYYVNLKECGGTWLIVNSLMSCMGGIYCTWMGWTA